MQRRKMVNDDVMNAYMKLLQSREESISSVEGRKMSICLPTTFYSNIENFGVSDARRKYRRRFESIAEADKLVIPINIDNVHWVLVIVSIPEKRITIIDSMRGEDEEVFPSKIRDFLNLFDCFSRHSWTLEKAHVPDHSHQPNTNQWDCGLFVLFYSDFILQKKKIGFNEAWVSASRNYVASCILKNLILA
jgi:Ulp1 family protease